MQNSPLRLTVSAGNHHTLGAVFDGQGVNFAVFSENASKIELCLYSEDGFNEIARLALPERTGPIWHGYVPDLKPGQAYGYRAYGPFQPDQGHRFNPNKLLADPYAREVVGNWTPDHRMAGGSEVLDSADSARAVPKSLVSEPDARWTLAPHPRRPWSETVIYEAHVKGLTMLHPGVDPDLRGTYDALGSKPVIDHLLSLGVTALELLPVHSFLDDGFLVERGLKNYWGYNTLGFFALESRYFGPRGLNGFREAVHKLHEAGIEVILDVVYNHTAEGDQRGPTLSFRGLDNASYYNLQSGYRGYYANDTGCGNTMNVSHPFVLRLVLDSLRYWVTVMGIDGFRFDLATTLGREDHGFDLHGGFFDAIRQDPALASCKLIAEPWDIGPGGYRLGGFPPDWGEWNDRFRDNVRRFWRGDDHAAQDLAGGLLGTASVFDNAGRRPASSVNFVSSHDGFTLADVTRYNARHNEANGENGADGHGENLSDNCGVEGDTEDADILARRGQRVRNILTTLLLSQGTPMLLAGDEIGNSQYGNNNAYCQDNSIGWIDWPKADRDLFSFVQKLLKIRREHPVLRQNSFLHSRTREDGHSDVAWTSLSGDALNWRDPTLDSFCLQVRGAADSAAEVPGCVLVAVNGGNSAGRAVLPDPGSDGEWERLLDTAGPNDAADVVADPAHQPIAAHSIVVFSLRGGAG